MRNMAQFLAQNICILLKEFLSLQYKNKELLYLQNDRRNSKLHHEKHFLIRQLL